MSTYRQLTLNKNAWMSGSPGSRGLGIYNGTYVDAPSGTIMFLDASGNTIETAECGTPMQFLVKDYTQVYLKQTHDGKPQWDGPIDSPVNYTTSCWNAPGAYHGQVFDMAMNPIGEYDFTITGSWYSGLMSGYTPYLLGGALLLLVMRHKRRG